MSTFGQCDFLSYWVRDFQIGSTEISMRLGSDGVHYPCICFFCENGQSQPLLCLFSTFPCDTIQSLDGVLGTQTWGYRMVGAYESTKLWLYVLTDRLLSSTR